MKNGLSKPAIVRIQLALAAVIPGFNSTLFLQQCLHELEAMELKERVTHIIAAISHQCPDFTTTAPALMSLPKNWDYGNAKDALKGFAAWPIIDYVAVQGINQPALAFEVLAELTHLFSAEFAIRPFIDKYPEQSFKQLLVWSKHPSEHIRRLASEGCRPRLPWGMQLKKLVVDPTPILAILEPLNNDGSLYVRKSVANNLNDIAKDNPNITLNVCEQWQSNGHKNTQWIIKHACRTLIKEGHPRCLSLLGFKPAKISAVILQSKNSVVMGNNLAFDCSIHSDIKQNLVIDYSIDFLRSNGKTNNKVFKLKTVVAEKNETVKILKEYSFKAITTRKYYPGLHRLNIHINGAVVASRAFELTTQ